MKQRFEFVKMSCCNAICVFDTRMNELYFLPSDPTRHACLDFPQPCPLCLTKSIKFESVYQIDECIRNKWACLVK